MPRTADHDARRRQVAEALIGVIADSGIATASIRRVAAAAGVSAGLVQRYFRTKNELLRFAFAHLYERTLERLQDAADGGSVRERLISGLSVLIPFDDERRREAAVWLTFLPETRHDAELLRAHREATVLARSLVADALDAAKSTGECAADVDSATEAARLVATVDGIALHMATMPDLCDAAWGGRALAAAVDHALMGVVEGDGASRLGAT